VARLNAPAVTAWGEVTRSRDALKAVGDRTRVVWLGFDLNNLDDLRTAADTVHVVLEGDFPKGAAALMLDWNGEWKKGAVPGIWTQPKLDLSVSLPEDNLVVVRRHDPATPQPAAGVLRDLDPRAVENADVWISFWNPGEALFGSTGGKLLRVDRLDVILSAQANGFLEGPVLLRFADDRSAKAAGVLLKLFGPQVRARLGQDLTWTAEGSRLTGETLKIRQSDLKALAEKLVADPVPPEAAP
jgi:hypothetical protein